MTAVPTYRRILCWDRSYSQSTYIASWKHHLESWRRQRYLQYADDTQLHLSTTATDSSVVHAANNSRTPRPSVTKCGRNVSHLRCNSLTSFKFKRSKVSVTRPINADTHRVPYLPNGKPTTTTRISHMCHDLQGQRSRSQGLVISLSPVGPMAHKSKPNSRSITKIGTRVPYDMCCMTSFKVKRSKVGVTGRLTQTHKMCDIFRTVRPKNFKLGMRMKVVDPHQRQVP